MLLISEKERLRAIQELSAARELLALPGVWTRFCFARNKKNVQVTLRTFEGALNPQAVKFCPYGALLAAVAKNGECGHGPGYAFLQEELRKIAPTKEISNWNDMPERTLEEVVGLFDRAISTLEEGSTRG